MRNMFSSQISSVPEEGLDQLTVPKSVQARLPPGISLSHTGSGESSSSNKRPAASGSASFTMTPAQEEPPPKRVALPDNVAGALASISSSPASASKKKVELELSTPTSTPSRRWACYNLQRHSHRATRRPFFEFIFVSTVNYLSCVMTTTENKMSELCSLYFYQLLRE